MQQQTLKEGHEKSTTLAFRLGNAHLGAWYGHGGCNIKWLQEHTETRLKKLSDVSGLWSATGLGDNCDRVVAYAKALEFHGYLPCFV